MKNDAEVMNHAKKHNILIEMCPTSNVQTKAVAAFSEFPFIELVTMESLFPLIPIIGRYLEQP